MFAEQGVKEQRHFADADFAVRLNSQIFLQKAIHENLNSRHFVAHAPSCSNIIISKRQIPLLSIIYILLKRHRTQPKFILTFLLFGGYGNLFIGNRFLCSTPPPPPPRSSSDLIYCLPTMMHNTGVVSHWQFPAAQKSCLRKPGFMWPLLRGCLHKEL